MAYVYINPISDSPRVSDYLTRRLNDVFSAGVEADYQFFKKHPHRRYTLRIVERAELWALAALRGRKDIPRRAIFACYRDDTWNVRRRLFSVQRHFRPDPSGFTEEIARELFQAPLGTFEDAIGPQMGSPEWLAGVAPEGRS